MNEPKVTISLTVNELAAVWVALKDYEVKMNQRSRDSSLDDCQQRCALECVLIAYDAIKVVNDGIKVGYELTR